METTESNFTIYDYSLFAVFLCVSVAVGAYHAWKARRTADVKQSESAVREFLTGGRSMPILPVSLSVLATFQSGITLLGTPAEVFQRGLLWWVFYLSASLAMGLTAWLFIPIFHRLQLISIYEYFELRFRSRPLRRITAFLFMGNTLAFLAVVMYAPAVALSGVTGVPQWPFILSVGLTGTFYTSIGGLKAVVWTDTLQATFMYAGLAILIFKGASDAGGFGNVFDIAFASGRVGALWEHLNPDPAQYISLWSAIFGGMFFWLSLFGLNQMSMQRYNSLSTVRNARIVAGITAVCFLLMGSLACLIGLIMLAYFYHCNPMETGAIASQDQLVIKFATNVLGDFVPGAPGLFLAALMSGTLSSISSGLNSMTAVIWEDFLKSGFGQKMSDSKSLIANRILVTILGAVSMLLAFSADYLGGIIQTSLSIFGAFTGPLIGLFMLGLFVPRANRLCAFICFGLAEVFLLWISIGAIVTKPYAGYALDTNRTCVLETGTQWNSSNVFVPHAELHYGTNGVFYAYRISNNLYTLFGTVIIVGVGVPLSRLLSTSDDVTAELAYFARRRQNDRTTESYIVMEKY